MSSDNLIWTGEVRRLLYRRLVAEFGPHDATWKPRPDGFHDFCTAFACVVGAKSGRAVNIQVNYAVNETPQGDGKAALLNKAAAVEAGFLTATNFDVRTITKDAAPPSPPMPNADTPNGPRALADHRVMMSGRMRRTGEKNMPRQAAKCSDTYTDPSNYQNGYRKGYLFEIWRKHGEQPVRDANKAFGTPDAPFAQPLKDATVESWIRFWDRECRGWRTGL